MRQIAQRIERLLRNDFLFYTEAMTNAGQESFEDRQHILQRTQQLIAEGYERPTAKRIAVEEWLTNFLNDNCVKM